MMSKHKDLISATDDFFKTYWNCKNEVLPDWSKHWVFVNSVPNHEKRGCYALLENDEIIYVGSALGSGYRNYKGNGLGFRLKRYYMVDKNNKSTQRKYMPTEDWSNLTSIVTIGFPDEHYHLAAALEIYLITKLNPRRNKLHRNDE
ncbi:MAG: hypothetical protein H6607_04295 [Flavobacteriales bacterium]|nr:hypothetical protein [Flavobacteriales bacterium]